MKWTHLSALKGSTKTWLKNVCANCLLVIVYCTVTVLHRNNNFCAWSFYLDSFQSAVCVKTNTGFYCFLSIVIVTTSVFFKYTFVFLQYSDIFHWVLTWTLYSNDCSNTTSFIWFDSLCSNVLDLHLKTQSKSWQYFLSYKVIFSTNNKTLWNFTIIWAGVWRVQCTCTGL